MIMAENYLNLDIFDATFYPQCSPRKTQHFLHYLKAEAYMSQNSNSTVNDDDVNGSSNSFHESNTDSKQVIHNQVPTSKASNALRAYDISKYTNLNPDAVHVISGESDEQKKVTIEKIAFKTKSDIEILDDGFKWRKYGKKMVKNSPNPRNYYRCAVEGCPVKKRVDRDKEDSQYVITTTESTIIRDILSFDFSN